ncbi:hypothetical protein FHE72_17365 [Rossellomorea vietnamensis]|uniref:Uncharacterized protein n=1 Tax=Rossellomorea vietnamensis TaxID=218284 RepID=A0A6I6UI76_9BACI|nr:DUF6615 family protein [Rossellomorea vietnamensis]QHE62595.1 hypothetical protein FHE72_17365 [Rossellomorea vietnamensis]
MSKDIVNEVKQISTRIWNRLKLEPDENWANAEVTGSLKEINPSELFAIKAPNENVRGGDIEIWVVDRSGKMICFLSQAKRLYSRPSESIKDRYDELNYNQLSDLLGTADNEKNIPLYLFYNTPYKNGYFISKDIHNPEDNGWRYSYAHNIYTNYCSWNGDVDHDAEIRYRDCSQVYPISEPMYELVTGMVKKPDVILNNYLSLRKKLDNKYQSDNLVEENFLKMIPKKLKKFMTEDQIKSHKPYFALLQGEDFGKARPIWVIKSAEYF